MQINFSQTHPILLKSQVAQIEFVPNLIPFLALIMFHLIAIIYSFWLWKNAVVQSRRAFLFLALAFCCVIVDSSIYNLTYNFLQISRSQVPFSLVSLDNLTFIGYLACMLFFLIYVLPKNKIKNKLWLVFAAVIVLVFFIISFVTHSRTNGPLAYRLYDIIETFLDLTGLAAAILCLALSKNRGLFFISFGYALGMVVDLTFDFNLFSQSYNIGSVMETLWIATWLFQIYGLMCFKSNLSYKESPQNWVSNRWRQAS